MLAISPTDDTLRAKDLSADTEPLWPVPEPERLPAFVALPLILGLSLGLWVLLWKAGQGVLTLLS